MTCPYWSTARYTDRLWGSKTLNRW
jgi:hypothetical protein